MANGTRCVQRGARTGSYSNESQRLREVSAVINCEIEHANDVMPRRNNETRGARGLAKVFSAQKIMVW